MKKTTVSIGNVVVASIEGRATAVRIDSSPTRDGKVKFTKLATGEACSGTLAMNRAALRSIAIANIT